jgi:hypothetical protein
MHHRAQQEMLDRRSEIRRAVGTIVAQIDCLDGERPVAGVIWDLSSRGACIFMRHPDCVPERLAIILDSTPRLALVVWRSGNHIGVRFDDAPEISKRQATRPLGTLRQVFQGAMLSLGRVAR